MDMLKAVNIWKHEPGAVFASNIDRLKFHHVYIFFCIILMSLADPAKPGAVLQTISSSINS